jgi:hypothetical protein
MARVHWPRAHKSRMRVQCLGGERTTRSVQVWGVSSPRRCKSTWSAGRFPELILENPLEVHREAHQMCTGGFISRQLGNSKIGLCISKSSDSKISPLQTCA